MDRLEPKWILEDRDVVKEPTYIIDELQDLDLS